LTQSQSFPIPNTDKIADSPVVVGIAQKSQAAMSKNTNPPTRRATNHQARSHRQLAPRRHCIQGTGRTGAKTVRLFLGS
jgi:hypothetical protein